MSESIQTVRLDHLLGVYRVGSGDWSWQDEYEILYESDHQHQLTKQIRENGITEPILLGDDGRVWDGHHRICAAMHIGIDSIPVEWARAAGVAPQEQEDEDVVVFASGQRIPVTEFDAEDDAPPSNSEKCTVCANDVEERDGVLVHSLDNGSSIDLSRHHHPRVREQKQSHREELIEEAKSRMRGEIHMPGRVFLSGVVDALSSPLVLDPEKVAEVIESEIDKLRHETRLYPDVYKGQVADAICEAAKRGDLT